MSLPASSWLDPVVGLDVHWEIVPTPAGPIPTPLPNPFTGIVFDPMGLAVGLAISNAIGAAMGASFKGPVVYWGAIPATNTGANAKHIPGHILIPPGTSWAPFPRTPKPTIHPGETPAAPSPVKPYDDAAVVFGSKTVSVMGSNAVRMGDIALSCSEPVRLPSSFVIAIPKGAPILIGGPMSLDLMAAVMASLKTRFMSDSVHALISRMKPSRFRSVLQKAACFLTGHPVDVASGRALTDATDAVLPGPMPLRIERNYDSAFAARSGTLGHGWSCSLDQAVWEERGQAVWRAADGREIVFDAFDLPGHRMAPGDSLTHPIDRVTLRKHEAGAFSIVDEHANRYDFAPATADAQVASLARVTSPCGNHAVDYGYDEGGLLDQVRDASGRLLRFEHDGDGRLVALKLPRAGANGWYTHRAYTYDEAGDLVTVTDSQGHTFAYEYVTHLLVSETDRAGLSFHFEYDGFGADAWCTRTWGDGGVHDHRIVYDKAGHATFVTDSLGATSQYRMNAAGLVTEVVDALGASTKYEYDPRSFRRTAETNALGQRRTWTYDASGRLICETGFDGTTATREYDELGRRVRATDETGGEYLWRRDSAGRVVERVLPGGETHRADWHQGLLVAVTDPAGDRTALEYDEQKMLACAVGPDGSRRRIDRDRLGRVVAEREDDGPAKRFRYDSEGRVLAVESRIGVLQRHTWDPEGNLLEVEDATHRVQLGYGGYHWNTSRTAGPPGTETTVRWEMDTEGRVLAIVNEAGERHEFTIDEGGRCVAESGFDGAETRYRHDAADRLVEITRPSGASTHIEYDARGRRARVDNSDGTFIAFTYGPDGHVARAETETGAITLERDALGRALREVQSLVDGDAHEVRSRFAPGSGRVSMETSLGARTEALFDKRGDLESLHLGAAGRGASMRFERDALGRETARELPGGLRLEWARDEGGRPLMRRVRRGDEDLETQPYQWRGADRITRIGRRLFAYDGQGRLVAERLGEPGLDVSAEHVIELEVDDELPTWDDETRADPSRPGVERRMNATGDIFRRADRQDREYGPGGVLLEAEGVRYGYDLDGRRVSRVDPDGGEWAYGWDGHGNLTEVARPDGRRVCMRYDAFARRVERAVYVEGDDGPELEARTRFVWDGAQVVHEIDAGLQSRTTTWYWEPGTHTPVARERDQERWSLTPDHLGSPTGAYDSAGELAWRAQLDVFGVADVSTGAREDVPFRFPGQYDDAETGLAYSRFRHYDAEVGAFISPDPLGRAGGMRAYAYVHDPLRLSDPLGLTAKGGCTGVDEDKKNPWNEFQKAHAGQFDSPSDAAAAYKKLVDGQSPWPHGYTPVAGELPPGTQFHMAFEPGQQVTSPGGFGTQDTIVDKAFGRNELAIKTAWKGDLDRVVTFEVTQPLPVLSGPVGPQIDGSNYLPGGGTQVQMDLPRGVDRMDYLKVVGIRNL